MRDLKQEILDLTNYGYDVFMHYLPQIKDHKKAFKLREEERTPSARIKQIGDIWRLTDFGDSEQSKTCFDHVMKEEGLEFYNACKTIINDMGLPIEVNESMIEYKQPDPIEVKEFTKPFETFLTDKRKLSLDVVRNHGLTHTSKFMAQAKQELSCIAIPFFDNNQIVNYKYVGYYKDENGKTKKAQQQEKDSKRTFYNIDSLRECTDNNVIICEGEFDALAIETAIQGSELKSYCVISVPNGVNSLNSIISENWDLLNKNGKQFYIFVDADEAGVKLESELCRRLGKNKCSICSKYGFKDANDILVSKGKDIVIEAILKAYMTPIEGEVKAQDTFNTLQKMFMYGLPKGASAGYDNLDKVLTFGSKQLSVVTGIPNHGKSNFLDQILVNLASYEGWRTAFFSPEYGIPEYHIKQLQEIYTGKCFKSEAEKIKSMHGQNIDDTKIMDHDVFINSFDFINSHFYFLEHKKPTPDSLLDSFRDMVLRYGVNAIVIDPFNRILGGNSQDKLSWINEFLTKLNQFKKEYDVHIFLVAHPRKMGKNRKEQDENGNESFLHDVPSVYDIAHSSDFANQVDNAISVYRNMNTNEVEIYIQKVKFRHFGKIGSTRFGYDIVSGRYDDIESIAQKSNNFYEITNVDVTKEIKKEDEGIPF